MALTFGFHLSGRLPVTAPASLRSMARQAEALVSLREDRMK
jgi:hypothetical protein